MFDGDNNKMFDGDNNKMFDGDNIDIKEQKYILQRFTIEKFQNFYLGKPSQPITL